MGKTKSEELKTKEIIDKFKSNHGFKLQAVNRKINNYKQYKYDIEVLKDGKTVAIVEAKIKENATTDGIIASLVKATHERQNHFQGKVCIILLFYVNVNSKIKDKDTLKNGVLINLNSLLKDEVDFKIMHINIMNDLNKQIEEFDKQLNQLIT